MISAELGTDRTIAGQAYKKRGPIQLPTFEGSIRGPSYDETWCYYPELEGGRLIGFIAQSVLTGTYDQSRKPLASDKYIQHLARHSNGTALGEHYSTQFETIGVALAKKIRKTAPENTVWFEETFFGPSQNQEALVERLGSWDEETDTMAMKLGTDLCDDTIKTGKIRVPTAVSDPEGYAYIKRWLGKYEPKNKRGDIETAYVVPQSLTAADLDFLFTVAVINEPEPFNYSPFLKQLSILRANQIFERQKTANIDLLALGLHSMDMEVNSLLAEEKPYKHEVLVKFEQAQRRYLRTSDIYKRIATVNYYGASKIALETGYDTVQDLAYQAITDPNFTYSCEACPVATRALEALRLNPSALTMSAMIRASRLIDVNTIARSNHLRLINSIAATASYWNFDLRRIARPDELRQIDFDLRKRIGTTSARPDLIGLAVTNPDDPNSTQLSELISQMHNFTEGPILGRQSLHDLRSLDDEILNKLTQLVIHILKGNITLTFVEIKSQLFEYTRSSSCYGPVTMSPNITDAHYNDVTYSIFAMQQGIIRLLQYAAQSGFDLNGLDPDIKEGLLALPSVMCDIDDASKHFYEGSENFYKGLKTLAWIRKKFTDGPHGAALAKALYPIVDERRRSDFDAETGFKTDPNTGRTILSASAYPYLGIDINPIKTVVSKDMLENNLAVTALDKRRIATGVSKKGAALAKTEMELRREKNK